MKRLSIIILAIVALVAGCTREDDITPITPSQPDQIHIKRVYVEQHLVIEALTRLRSFGTRWGKFTRISTFPWNGFGMVIV